MDSETPLFGLGHVVATQGAVNALKQTGTSPFELLARHQRGDFGELTDEDYLHNVLGVVTHGRILSSYSLAPDVKLWVITEADRSVTTILHPSEY